VGNNDLEFVLIVEDYTSIAKIRFYC